MSPASILATLETDRLRLRPMHPEDAEVFHRLWTERDPRVPPHRRLSASGHPTVDEIATSIREQDPNDRLRLLTTTLIVDDQVVGYCGLNGHGSGSPDEPELAFELLQAHQGHGYATEAARAIGDWAATAGYQRLWADVWDWNLASRRVLAKLGFRELGPRGATSEYGVSLLTMREFHATEPLHAGVNQG